MRRPFSHALLALAGLALTSAACGGARQTTERGLSAAEMQALADRNRAPHSAVDARFMTGMIPHHAQAVLFAGWAASHGAGRAVSVLCERIVVAQRDEIETMRAWLRDHGEPVPEPDARHMTVHMDGMEHQMLMPGMLSDEQLAELDAARGAEFDRLFLTFMIQHHEGALTMVDELFESYGGAQDDFVFKLASDIYADQTTEIERMQSMLAAHPPGLGAP